MGGVSVSAGPDFKSFFSASNSRTAARNSFGPPVPTKPRETLEHDDVYNAHSRLPRRERLGGGLIPALHSADIRSSRQSFAICNETMNAPMIAIQTESRVPPFVN